MNFLKLRRHYWALIRVIQGRCTCTEDLGLPCDNKILLYRSFVMFICKLTSPSKCTVQCICTLIVLCLYIYKHLLNPHCHTVFIQYTYLYIHCNSLWQSWPLHVQYHVIGKTSCYHCRLAVSNWITVKNNILAFHVT